MASISGLHPPVLRNLFGPHPIRHGSRNERVPPHAPGSPIQVIKFAACANAMVAPGSWDGWKAGGGPNQCSLPVDYQLCGFLLATIQVGGGLLIFRTSRNDIPVYGVFCSSTIRRIEDDGRVITLNSVYELKLS